MNTAVLNTPDSLTMPRRHGFGLAGLVKRLQRLAPRHAAKPHWSRVPDRVWRRHSAMLTFHYEAQTGGE